MPATIICSSRATGSTPTAPPVTWSIPPHDFVTDTMINSTTWESVWTKNGKIVEREVETISADGKIFHEIDQGKDEKGNKYKNHLVFERP
jgi:hypothetical protein